MFKEVNIVDDKGTVYRRWHGVVASFVHSQRHMRRRQIVGVGQRSDVFRNVYQLTGRGESRSVNEVNAGDIGRFSRGDGGAHLGHKLYTRRNDGQFDLAVVVGVPGINQCLRLEADQPNPHRHIDLFILCRQRQAAEYQQNREY